MGNSTATKHQAASKAEVMAEGKKLVNVNGLDILIVHVDGEFYAWRDVCPHFAAPMHKGVICGTRLTSDVYEYQYGKEQQIIRCPWHQWEFDLRTGKHLADEENGVKLRGFPIETDEDYIYVLTKG